MAAYIYGRKKQIHIIDIRETVRGILRAKKYLSQVAEGGSLVLFVGTKRQASATLARAHDAIKDLDENEDSACLRAARALIEGQPTAP